MVWKRVQKNSCTRDWCFYGPAFEVLSRDAFETLLNKNPGNIQALISHPKTRKRFEAEKLPLDTLLHHGFDLSSRLGSVLVHSRTLVISQL